MPCVTSGIHISDLIATHPEVLGGRECIPDPVVKFSLYSAYSSGWKTFGRWESMFFVTFALSITFKSIIL